MNWGGAGMDEATVRISEEVSDALAAGAPVVALESTIFSAFGLPSPHNVEALERCEGVVRAAGAVPAMTALLDGVARVGVEAADVERVVAGDRKMSARDLPVAMAQRWEVGVTTVAASVLLADRAGVEVFATGGIGGVHRGAATSGDVSADLGALAAHRVVTVTAGAKAFLDLPRTVEHLDTLAVPLVGWRTDEFPAFYSRSSGVPVPHRAETAAEVAAVARGWWSLGGGGVVVANPIPEEAAIPAAEVDAAIEDALAGAEAAGVAGGAVTPFVLAALAEATAGRSLPANLALAESNAEVAAEIAVELAGSAR